MPNQPRQSFVRPWLFQDPLIHAFERPDNALAMCQHLSSAPHRRSTLRPVSMVPSALLFHSQDDRCFMSKSRTITVQKSLSRALCANSVSFTQPCIQSTHMLWLAPRLLPEVIFSDVTELYRHSQGGSNPSPIATHYGEPLRTSTSFNTHR